MTFTDPRDGQTYKTVKINGQVWLGENLRYKCTIQKFNNWMIEKKDFYHPPDGKQKNIKEYGCLYTWDNAIKACPEGWHLPSREDFKNLLRVAGNTDRKRFMALTALDWNGYNILDFGALPAGYYYGSGKYRLFCGSAVFWSSTEHDFENAYLLNLDDGYAGMGYTSKDSAFSVRCVRD